MHKGAHGVPPDLQGIVCGANPSDPGRGELKRCHLLLSGRCCRLSQAAAFCSICCSPGCVVLGICISSGCLNNAFIAAAPATAASAAPPFAVLAVAALRRGPQLVRQLQPRCTAFRRPDIGILLLQPTNHLDLEACVWLEETLKNFKRILLLVSHSQDFMVRACCWLGVQEGTG